ncbi:Na+/H+ antiporter NhaC family protein [Limnochorda pilosa]|uniref:Sodium:proton antiporter n=1 Tax=Limnochorda pilosa TaxID=1555112 RepID=A0A0K2SQJ1_LIMPI|nr:Na+/H+ antiporter NhaC family protein [Limnochorda pilosa]BAS29262.1 sodium:proton antiporter [Limnochorda pilosa]
MPEPWTSALPPLLAIGLAAATRQVIPSLLVGLWVGAALASPGLIASASRLVDLVGGVLADRGNLDVLLFLYLFGGLVVLLERAGGVEGFVRALSGRVRTSRGALSVAWAVLPLTFIDCGFRVVTTGALVTPLARRVGVSPERVAYTLNNTASPLIALIPAATTFLTYMLAVLGAGMTAAQIDGSRFALFLRTIPFNFFSWTSLAVALASLFARRQWGLMEESEAQARGDEPAGEKEAGRQRLLASPSLTGLQAETAKPLTPETPRARAATARQQTGTAEGHPMQKDEPVLEPRIVNLLAPVLLLISLSFGLLWWDGRAPGRTFVQAVAAADASRMMLVALLLTLVLAGLSFAAQGFPLRSATEALLQGGNRMMTTIVILALAWPIATVAQELGLPELIRTAVGARLGAPLVPLLVFAVTGALTYAVGSSWGAWALMMPLALPLATSAGASVALTAAAVFSGGTFGDVTSPLSGMTAMAAGAAQADHMSYVRAMTPYNLVAAGAAALFFAVAGLARL